MDFLLNFVNMHNMNSFEYKHLTFSAVAYFAMPFILMLSFMLSRKFIRMEMDKLKKADSPIVEQIIILVSSTAISAFLTFFSAIIINLICRKLGYIPAKVISSGHLTLSLIFSVILAATYTLLVPKHSHLRLVNFSDDEAVATCNKFVRIMLITFLITAVACISNYLLKHSPNRLILECSFCALLILYYCAEMTISKKNMGSLTLLDKSNYSCASAELVAFINKKFTYIALIISSIITMNNFASCRKSALMFFTNMNHICFFLISMFAVQIVISLLVNRFLKYLTSLQRSNIPEESFSNRRENFVWICNILVTCTYLFIACFLLKHIGLDVNISIFHGKVAVIAWIVFITLTVYKMFNEFKESALEKSKLEDPDYHAKLMTFLPPASITFNTMLFIVSTLIILSNLGIDIAPMLAAFSIFGVAIGLAAKDIIQSFLQGITLLLERNLFVGEFVKINEMSGVIEKLSLRVLYLRSTNGNLHAIPYNLVNTITNCSKDYICHSDILHININQDVDEVIKLIKDIVYKMKNEPKYSEKILSDAVVHGVMPFDLTGLRIYWEIKTVPDATGVYIKCEIYRRLVEEFKKRGMDLPVFNNMSITTPPKTNL